MFVLLSAFQSALTLAPKFSSVYMVNFLIVTWLSRSLKIEIGYNYIYHFSIFNNVGKAADRPRSL